MQNSFTVWSSSKEFEYKLVHGWKDYHPWCTYVMVHHSTEPASKVKPDIFKGSVRQTLENVSNEALVPIIDTVPAQYSGIATKFEEAVYLYSSVIPSAFLEDMISMLQVQGKQLKLVKEKMEDTDVAKAETVKSIESVRNHNFELLERVVDIDRRYKMEVSKETQRNEFCFKLMSDVLTRLNFVCKPSIETSTACLFGKSLMDMYFYKNGGGSIVSAGIVKKLEGAGARARTTSHGEAVISAVAEFKCEASNMKVHYAQTFADMVRVGSLLAYDALTRGKLIDKVVVYGLLTNYTTKLATVFKYYINFTNDESVFLIGQEMNAVKAFVGIVQALDNIN